MTGKNLYQVFIHIAVIVLAAEVFILATQNDKLKNPARPESMKAGEYFSFSQLKSLDGTELATSTRRRVVFVFNAKCPFCVKSLPYWHKIDSVATAMKINVVGIGLDSLSSIEAYAREHAFGFSVFVPTDIVKFKERNKITGVPHTVLVSGDGRVESLWSGMIDEKSYAEVIRLLL